MATARRVNEALKRERLTRYRAEDNPSARGEVVIQPGGMAAWTVRAALALCWALEAEAARGIALGYERVEGVR